MNNSQSHENGSDQVDQIFGICWTHIILKMYSGGGPAHLAKQYDPYWYALAGKFIWENDLSIAPMDSTNSKIQPT